MPQPLMRGHQAFDGFPSVGVRRRCPAHEHGFQYAQQLFSDFIVALVASVMKGEENLIG